MSDQLERPIDHKALILCVILLSPYLDRLYITAGRISGKFHCKPDNENLVRTYRVEVFCSAFFEEAEEEKAQA